MALLPAAVRRAVARKLITTTVGRRSGLSGVSVLPRRITMPLRRDLLDPIPALASSRAAAPVSKLGKVLGTTVWLVTGYEQARSVLEDRTRYSTDIRPMMGTNSSTDIAGLGFTDPPEHTSLRAILTPEFTARRLARLKPQIARIVERQLDVLESRGEVADLVEDFAFPIPFAVICELLGLPVEDRQRFRELGRGRFDVNGGGPGTFGAMSETQRFLIEAVRRQRVRPGDGLIGEIIRTHGDQLTDVALAGLCDGAFTGGYETSAGMLALGVLQLLRCRDALGMASDAEGLDALIEELLRYLSVVQIAFPRFAREDLIVSGQHMRRGDVVICSLSGANRDPVFGADAEAFNPARVRKPHLAFGRGPHRCIGAELARMELREALSAFARRFPNASLAVEADQLSFHKLSIVYGISSLPIRLGAAVAQPSNDGRTR